jgi:hypothetical protein
MIFDIEVPTENIWMYGGGENPEVGENFIMEIFIISTAQQIL